MFEDVNADDAGGHLDLLPIAGTGWEDTGGRRADKGGYGGAGKILIPHKSWPCGMPGGIPVPERGVPVFEANLKLDQAYDVGKTPYGQREVFVIQGGTVSGEKINGSVMPGGTGLSVEFFKRRHGN